MRLNVIRSLWKEIAFLAVGGMILVSWIFPINEASTVMGLSHFQAKVLAVTLYLSGFSCLLYLFNREFTQKVRKATAPLNNKNLALNAHSLVSMTDRNGVITYVNDKFIEVSGYSEDELLGRKHSILNSNNQPKDYWKNMYDTVLAGNIWQDEVRNRAKNGQYYWVATTIVPNLNSLNEIVGFTSIRTDITQQKEIERNLVLATQRAETAKFALDQHSLVSFTDIEGTITYVNDKFIEVSGYLEEELIGRKHSILNSNNQPKSYWKKMYETVIAGEIWHDEVRNRAKGGHYYWVDTTIVPSFNPEREVIGFTSIRTDITQQKAVAKSLEVAKEEAEAASVSKADFLANMSHEIRTPMNGVIGMTNLLLDSPLTKEQEKLASTVKSSAEGLLAILNDILDFSKVEAGKLDLELIPFNLGQMVEDVGATMVFQAQNKDLQLICPATPVIQQWVTADPGRIRQILTNLIGNAIKFTERGEVAVFVQTIEQTEKHKTYLFEVKDTGIGVNEEQQQGLFDKFSQADTSTTRKYGGTGLGLSICKSLAELMGGEIGVRSILGEGSTFWFKLPLMVAEAEEETPARQVEISNEKILIVDDNETNLELMHQLHLAWGIPHKLTNCASIALKELREQASKGTPYTTAIFDMHMPDVDGVTLCREVKADPLIAGTKLVMASSQAQRGDAAKMKEAGFSGYVTKPIQQSELLNVLLMVSGMEMSKPEFATRHSAKDKIRFKAHVLVVEDNSTNQMVIQGLLSSLGVTVDIANNGAEAIAQMENNHTHDLVFMDCQMPVLDGYGATQKIRANESGTINHDIPIIAMTANAMAGDQQKCLDAGMSDYLAKPIVPEKVIDMLVKWLPKEEVVHKDNMLVKKKPAEQKQGASATFDYPEYSKRLMNNGELMLTIAEAFWQDCETHIGQFKQQVESDDVELALATIHQIKGSAANVSAVALSALARDMEFDCQSGNSADVKPILPHLDKEFAAARDEMKRMLVPD